jgi:uncharacterized membrane protein (DUF106 family)
MGNGSHIPSTRPVGDSFDPINTLLGGDEPVRAISTLQVNNQQGVQLQQTQAQLQQAQTQLKQMQDQQAQQVVDNQKSVSITTTRDTTLYLYLFILIVYTYVIIKLAQNNVFGKPVVDYAHV